MMMFNPLSLPKTTIEIPKQYAILKREEEEEEIKKSRRERRAALRTKR